MASEAVTVGLDDSGSGVWIKFWPECDLAALALFEWDLASCSCIRISFGCTTRTEASATRSVLSSGARCCPDSVETTDRS